MKTINTMPEETPYWIALAHLPRWGHKKINNLIIQFHHEDKRSIIDLFHTASEQWQKRYHLTPGQIIDLKKAQQAIDCYTQLARHLYSNGYETIPIISPDYPKTLKTNLKATHSPALLYIRGNKHLLTQPTIAIVGTRTASATSLQFTDNVARKASQSHKVVVSGYAKGVDQQALASAMHHQGQSIIVLPQGILAPTSANKKYYQQINTGQLLLLSTFPPSSPWTVGQAMARNAVIYGLSKEIYIAQSNAKGGTWSGAIDGLKKGRVIYIRRPEPQEDSSNHLLIQKGALPVDMNGHPSPKSG